MEAFTINTIEIILLSLTGLFFLIQIIYYTTLYNRIYKRVKAATNGKVSFTEELPPLSVIICAKNESENLRKYLPAILEQDYPLFEVVVINDGSTDETEDLLSALEERYPHLYHSFTPEDARFVSRKKLAVTLGIKASKYDWLVFTEADCKPVNSNWLRRMARNFTPGIEIVLGYSGYEPAKGWFNRKVSLDTLFNSMRYLGFALSNHPYMGIGRNMAYRKELFFQKKGFSAHLNLRRGDDDVFINQIANSRNTRVETDEDAIIRSEQPSRKEWNEDKLSYAATSTYFKGSQRYFLGFETLSRMLFYMTAIALTVAGIFNHHWLVAAGGLLLFIVRFIIQAVVINKTAKALSEKRRYYFMLPLFDFMQPLQSLNSRIYRSFRKRGDFKGR